jgi:dipeptidyl-peptidase-4
MRIRLLATGAALAGAVLASSVRAQSTQSVPTLEWALGEGRTVGSVPSTQWLRDGSLLMLDTRTAASSRTFEVLDPATGERRKAFDMAAAVASVNALKRSAPLQVLNWPQALDVTGRRALFIFDGDLFLLEFATSKFVRLTTTPVEEQSPEFSPDGSRLAFVRSNDLYLIDCATRVEIRLTRDGSDTTLNGTLSWLYWEEIFGRRDIGYWWSPDSKSIAYLQTDDSLVPVSTFVDFQPEAPRVIRQHYPKAGAPNPVVRTGIVDLAGPRPTRWVRIIDKPFDTLLRVKWLPDGRRLSVQTQTRDQKEVRLYLVDRATGTATRVMTETGAGWINIHDDLHFLADGKHYLWASERDGNNHLYRYTLDGRLVNQVTHGPWSMMSSAGVAWVRQAVAGIDENAGSVYFTAMERSSVTRDLYRVGLDGAGMTRISAEAGSHRVSMAPNAHFYLDTFSDVTTLPSMKLRRPDGSTVQELAPPRTAMLAPYAIQWPELTTIPASDGFKMPARILRPANFRTDRKYPVIMHVYGGASIPIVSNAWNSDTLFYQLLLAEGFVVVKVDNRSATGISKTLENSVIGRLGEGEAADLVDAAKWLGAQPWVDPDRVGVWGWSNGGYMTLNLMTRSDAFKAGISVAPVTDWRFYDSRWSEAFLGMPRLNAKAYDNASPITRASALHGRVLIVYGTYDDNVHPQNELAFIDALIKAGKLFDVMVYPMRKHDIGDRDATLHLYRTMIEFWKKNL